MADLVNEIISPEAQKQLDFTSDQLDLLTKQVAELAQAGKAIQFDFKGAKDFAFADDVIKKATASAEAFGEAQQKLSKLTVQAARALELEEKANLANAKASTEAAKQKEIEIRYTTALTKEKERLEKQMQSESKAASKLGNDYEILKKAYTEAANRAKNLGVTVGIQSEAFKEASATALQMHNTLLKVEQAVGQSQRNVGNYTGSLMALSQVLREAPSFANGLRTGLSAIGNNMPILIDEFKKLSTELGSSTKALKIMGASLFSFNNLFVLAFTALQFLQIYLSKTTKATDDYAASLREVKRATEEFIQGEQSKTKILLDTIGDLNNSYGARAKAIDDLLKIYPELLSNMEKEDVLAGKIGISTDKLTKITALRGENVRLQGEIDELKKSLPELEKVAAETAEKLNEAEGLIYKGIGSGYETAKNNALAAASALNEAKAEIGGHKDVIEKYNAEIAKALGADNRKDKKEKKPKETRDFKGEQELAKARYELAKQQLEQDRDTQKAIADNTEEGLQTRLDAYMKYTADLQQLAAAEAIKEIELQEANIASMQRIRQTANATEKADLDKKIIASQIYIKAAEEKFSKVMSGIAEDGQKDVLGIIKTSNEQWIKDESDAFNDFRVQKLQQYHIQERLLTDALDKGLITRKEYDSKLAKIEADKNITILEAEVAFDRTLLDNKQLTADQELKIREDLAKKEESLANASNGGAKANNPSRGRGRITDPIAKGLLPTDAFKDDAAGMEAYLNEFYNGAINLANQAADAIIQAQNRQFDNMIKNLDAEKEQITTNAQLKEDAINAGTANQIDKQNEIAKLHAQTAIQEEQIEEKKRKIEQDRARFERAAAIASIIQSTAIAIASALKYGPGAPAIIALIAASGAAQLAAVASSPIPAYKDGTTGHRGGLFIAGDGGEPEYIQAPGKAGYWSASKSTLYNEAQGTTVTPLSKIMGMDASRMGAFSGSDSTLAIKSMSQSITDKLDETIEAYIYSANKQRIIIQDNAPIAHELRKQRKLQ